MAPLPRNHPANNIPAAAAPFGIEEAERLRTAMLDQVAGIIQIQAAAGQPLSPEAIGEIKNRIIGLSDQQIIDQFNAVNNAMVPLGNIPAQLPVGLPIPPREPMAR